MADPTDPQAFRTTLGHFPTGVTAVTALDDDGPVGMAIGSFTSVSLDPPLVAWLPTRTSDSWARIRATGSFCVNVMTFDQMELCGIMASKSDDKFSTCSWRSGATGSPIIEGSLAWIDCEIDTVHEAGDHDIVVGRVVEMDVAEGDAAPLLFFRGGYGTFSG